MKGKIVLITGSTDGIGKQTAIDLARMGARVILHGRNPIRTEGVRKEVRAVTGLTEIESVSGDLSSLDEIRRMSEDLHGRFDRIDVLINNAGVYVQSRKMSRDGFEMTFAVNHLSYFLLTGLLLDMVMRSGYARIINVASQAHASRLDFSNLQGELQYDAYDAYARSKLSNILFTYRLADKLKDSHVTVNVLHPGVIATKLLREGWGGGGSRLAEGSKTSTYLAVSPEVQDITGKYVANGKMTRSAAISYDPEIQEKLWLVSEEMAGYRY